VARAEVFVGKTSCLCFLRVLLFETSLSNLPVARNRRSLSIGWIPPNWVLSTFSALADRPTLSRSPFISTPLYRFTSLPFHLFTDYAALRLRRIALPVWSSNICLKIQFMTR
jgi:hypothetical protein